MREKLTQIQENIHAMSFNQKALSGVALAVSLAVSGFAIHKLNEPSYVTLMTELDQASLQSIIPILEAESISFMVSPNNTTLLVDQSSMQKASVVLAKNGLPSKPTFGYEHLKSSSSPYVTKTTEEQVSRQILEENLVHSILQLDAVANAQVRLALAKNSQFLRDVAPASASVVLTIKKGKVLNRAQVDGISKLISYSVPNLPIENVIILDSTGRALSKDGELMMGSGSAIADHKFFTEEKLKQKLVGVIAPVVGLENLRVNVEAKLNFDKIESTTEAPLAASVVLSKQVEKSYDPELAGGGGVVGAVSNQPPTHAEFKEAPESSESVASESGVNHIKETTNFSVGKSITHTVKSVGEIQSLNVAILFNRSKFENDKLDEITSTIKKLSISSIGLDQERGDIISIEALAFATPEIAEKVDLKFYETRYFKDGMEVLKWFGGIFMLWLLFWNPLLKRISTTPKSEESSSDEQAGTLDYSNHSGESVVSNEQSQAEVTEQLYVDTISVSTELIENQPDAAKSVVMSWLDDQRFDELFQDHAVEEEESSESDENSVEEGKNNDK